MEIANLITSIIEKVRETIQALPEGHILSLGEAFRIAKEMVTQDALDRGVAIGKFGTIPHSRDVYHAAFYPVREMVAAQLVGLTLQDVIETTEKAVERFLGKSELAIVPKPTMAYSGECERYDPWNLYSNAIHADQAATKLKPNDPDDTELLLKLKKALQLLHFLTQRDVLREDIDGKPYDGTIRDQAWLDRSGKPIPEYHRPLVTNG